MSDKATEEFIVLQDGKAVHYKVGDAIVTPPNAPTEPPAAEESIDLVPAAPAAEPAEKPARRRGDSGES